MVLLIPWDKVNCVPDKHRDTGKHNVDGAWGLPAWGQLSLGGAPHPIQLSARVLVDPQVAGHIPSFFTGLARLRGLLAWPG